MPVIVPRDFNFPSRTGIASRKPVRGVQLARIGHALNYLRGHGHVVIPATRLSAVAIPAGSAYVYHFITPLQTSTRHLVWHLVPRVDTGMSVVSFSGFMGTGGVLQGVSSGGAVHTTTVLAADPARRPLTTAWRVVEALDTAPSSLYLGGASEITIENDASSTADLYIDSIGCYALPRETLEFDADDVGINVPTCGPELPIFDADDYLSIGALSRAMEAGESTATFGTGSRALFAFSRPEGYGIPISGGSWTPIFVEGPCIQAHHRFRGEVLRRVWCNARGTVDGGSAMEVRFTAASGDTATKVSVGATWSFPVALDADAEDLAASDGRRDATDEIVTIEARISSGAGSGTVESVSLIDGVISV